MAQKKQMAANKFGGPAQERVAAEAEFIGNFEEIVANPEGPPIINQTGESIPQGPQLQLVRPGDLITAQYINTLVAAIQNLQTRVGDLEEPTDFSASATVAAAS